MSATQRVTALITTALALSIGTSDAADISLFDFGFNTDGFVSGFLINPPNNDGAVPDTVDLMGWDSLFGLGDVVMTVTGVGDHHVGMYVDHEIDGLFDFADESGAAVGSPEAGSSWSIDDPFFTIAADVADGDPFLGSFLSNTNWIDGLQTDVSMAFDWDFSLGVGQTALVSFLLRTDDPFNAGFGPITDVTSLPFYLTHTDALANSGTGASIFFGTSIDIIGDPTPTPEPSTIALAAFGLCVLTLRRRLDR